jgi:Tat protein secretion system quality control protein TatD with DNase activity
MLTPPEWFRQIGVSKKLLKCIKRSGKSHWATSISFAGSLEEARPFLDLGYYFSFTGAVTFAR